MCPPARAGLALVHAIYPLGRLILKFFNPLKFGFSLPKFVPNFIFPLEERGQTSIVDIGFILAL